MNFFQFSLPTRVVFSPGLSRDFSSELDLIPARKYFIVTDRVLTDLRIVDPIVEGIKKSGREVAGVFSEVPPDSGVGVIETVAQVAKESGAEGLVAIGGGSVLDTAKGANILFTLGGSLVEDYSGAEAVGEELSPLIAIPTTAGTGSEVTEAIVILDEASSTKLSFVDTHLLPTLAILDPELTLGLPPKVTAATAMDAMTHSIEAVMSVQKGPVSDALAFHAVRLIFENLPKVLEQGSDIEARGALLVAANMAGIAFNHAMVGVVHAVAHTIGGLFHLHHGTANSILLPYGMQYNLEVRKAEIASLAPSLGVQTIGDVDSVARACIGAVKNFKKRLKEKAGLPVSLADAGIKKEDLEKIAEGAPNDGASFYNPREVLSTDLLPFLQRAFEGI